MRCKGGAPGTLRHTVDGGQDLDQRASGHQCLRKLFFLDAQHGWVAGGAGGGSKPKA